MNLVDALLRAIQYETKVAEVYRDAAEKVSDPQGRKALEALAREEGYHVDFLKQQLKNLQSGGRIDARDLVTKVPNPEQLQAQVSKLEKKLDPNPEARELALLSKALEVEQETSRFYAQMARAFSGPEGAFFKRFCEIEEGHLNLVQAEIDAVNHMGIWFDHIEFNLEG